MSDVKRYDPEGSFDGCAGWMRPEVAGDWVSYEDYAALRARLAEVEAQLATAQHALVVWDAALRTGRNEPLVHAFEVGVDSLRQSAPS